MSLKTALKAIKAHEKFILTTHQRPDGDGLGSLYALHRGLQALGKDCISLISQEIPQKFAFIDKKRVIKKAAASPRGIADRILIVLDTNDGLNLGSLSDSVLPAARSVLFIDHHEVSSGFSQEAWIDPEAAATAEMVLGLLQAFLRYRQLHLQEDQREKLQGRSGARGGRSLAYGGSCPP